MSVRVELHSTTRDIDGVITGAFFMVVTDGVAYYENCPDGRWVKLDKIPKKEQFKMALDGYTVPHNIAVLLSAVVDVHRDRLLHKIMPASGLRILRKWACISQLELAKKAGYGQTTVAAWENGDRVPTIAGARAIVGALNIICKERGLPGTFTLDDIFP